MTAQHHDVQHTTPADEQCSTPDRTDPLGPITLPTRYKVGARAMALVGVVGLSAAAAAVMVPDGLPFGTI
jgi:hypothetical protein